MHLRYRCNIASGGINLHDTTTMDSVPFCSVCMMDNHETSMWLQISFLKQFISTQNKIFNYCWNQRDGYGSNSSVEEDKYTQPLKSQYCPSQLGELKPWKQLASQDDSLKVRGWNRLLCVAARRAHERVHLTERKKFKKLITEGNMAGTPYVISGHIKTVKAKMAAMKRSTNEQTAPHKVKTDTLKRNYKKDEVELPTPNWTSKFKIPPKAKNDASTLDRKSEMVGHKYHHLKKIRHTDKHYGKKKQGKDPETILSDLSAWRSQEHLSLH